MKQFDSQGSEMEAQRKAILKNLEEKQATASRDANEFDSKLKSVNKIMDQLKSGWFLDIQRTFRKGCLKFFRTGIPKIIPPLEG